MKAIFCLLLALSFSAFSGDFSLHSDTFVANGKIPKDYTCQGADKSPALSWVNAPKNTQSFALIVDDPDAPDPKAPKMTWVHWVVYNIPATTTIFPDNTASLGVPATSRVGVNDWGKTQWGGPCPPIGEHRYFFKLYALDTIISTEKPLNKNELLNAMKGHILAQTQIIGVYTKE